MSAILEMKKKSRIFEIKKCNIYMMKSLED